MKPKTVLNKSPSHVSNQRKKDVIAIKSKFTQFDPEHLFQNAIKTYFRYLFVENCSCFTCSEIRNSKSGPISSLLKMKKKLFFLILFRRFMDEFRITLPAFVNMAAL